MTKREKRQGKCQLLGTEGLFAQSHIIPRFLGDKALGQAHRIELGEQGARPRLVFNSWTDGELCSRKGEERLRDIDTEAAKIFRRHGISWRHFPLAENASRTALSGDGVEIITIPDVDTEKLRLFFLSVLWRCAASSQFRFAEIHLSSEDLEYLRRVIVGEVDPKIEDWPATLLLLTDAGEPQVLGPMAHEIDMQSMGFDLPSIPIFRFFFDGLIVHMGRKSGDHELLDNWQGRVVGETDGLCLTGRPYSGSSQETNLNALMHEAHREHSDQTLRILSKIWDIDSRASGNTP